MRATKPMPPAMSRVPIATDPMRIGLSAVPNCATAHSLTGVGVRSMTVEPTASTGEASGETNPATRCPSPAPAAALSTVPTAYHRPRGRRGAAVGGVVVMQQVRSGGARRMWSRPQCARAGAGGQHPLTYRKKCETCSPPALPALHRHRGRARVPRRVRAGPVRLVRRPDPHRGLELPARAPASATSASSAPCSSGCSPRSSRFSWIGAPTGPDGGVGESASCHAETDA